MSSGTCYFENHMGECNNRTYAYTIAEEIGKPCIRTFYRGRYKTTESLFKKIEKFFAEKMKNI